MADVKLGKLTSVDVRELWKHEQYDFSSWLSKPDNIEYINDAIGLSLIDIEREVNIGSYRCDIVAKDELSNATVIIENQLESSNHDHLGKIITYASGLNASVVVWIVKEAKEEHRSAIEWLNNNTTQEIGFFLIELHAYKIGDSLPAPMFEIVEKPNDFIKTSKGNSSEGSDQRKQNLIEFWSLFNNRVIEKGKPFSLQKALPRTDYNIFIGSRYTHVTIALSNRENLIRVYMYIKEDEQYERFYQFKDQIEAEIPYSLTWKNNTNRKSSTITCDYSGLDFDDHSNYTDLFDAIIERATVFVKVFKKYL